VGWLGLVVLLEGYLSVFLHPQHRGGGDSYLPCAQIRYVVQCNAVVVKNEGWVRFRMIDFLLGTVVTGYGNGVRPSLALRPTFA
jgi:hypothetical protein